MNQHKHALNIYEYVADHTVLRDCHHHASIHKTLPCGADDPSEKAAADMLGTQTTRTRARSREGEKRGYSKKETHKMTVERIITTTFS